jgi:hypothetical protein
MAEDRWLFACTIRHLPYTIRQKRLIQHRPPGKYIPQ